MDDDITTQQVIAGLNITPASPAASQRATTDGRRSMPRCLLRAVMDRMEDRLILPDHGACPRDGANPDLRLLVAAAPAVAATATELSPAEWCTTR